MCELSSARGTAVARRLKPSRATAAVAQLGFKRRATAVLKSNLILSIEFSACYQQLFPKNLNPLWSQEPITGSEQLPHFTRHV